MGKPERRAKAALTSCCAFVLSGPDTYLMLQTSLASRAIDGLSDSDTREGVIKALMAYVDTDTIL